MTEMPVVLAERPVMLMALLIQLVRTIGFTAKSEELLRPATVMENANVKLAVAAKVVEVSVVIGVSVVEQVIVGTGPAIEVSL